MPTPQSGAQTPGWFADAPEDALDPLFQDPNAAQPAPAAPAPTPEPAVVEEPFLKGSRSVYKTKEEALKGLDTKDAAIEQLRQRIIEKEGIDPLTGKPIAASPTPQPSRDYQQNPEAFLSDIADAVQRQDSRAYAEVQARFVENLLQPYLPILASGARDSALRSLPTEVSGFVGSTEYKQSLDANPTLANAIKNAETNPAFAAQLSELYRLAYGASVALGLKPAAQPTAVQSNPPVRPTTPSATLTPPSTPSAQPSLASRDGRKAIIEQAQRSGLLDMAF